MSMFEDPRFRWRETYFVQFDPIHRPTLEAFKKSLESLGEHFQVENLSADDEGRFESCTLLAPDDCAAIDISYLEGEEVLEQGFEMANELEDSDESAEGFQRVNLLRVFTGRFDVLHFEQVDQAEEDSDNPEVLDPSSLFLVLEKLATLTEGIPVDPQSGCFCE